MKLDKINVLLMVTGAALVGLILAFQKPLVVAGHWFFAVVLSVHLPLLPF